MNAQPFIDSLRLKSETNRKKLIELVVCLADLSHEKASDNVG